MKENGIVKSINDKEIMLEISPSLACSKCCSCNKGKQRIVKIENNGQNVHIGEKIEYEVEAKNMVGIFLMMYGIPLVFFLLCLFITHFMTKNAPVAFFAGILGVAITYLFIGIFVKKHPSFVPKTCINKKVH